MMAKLERLIHDYRVRASSPVTSKLDVLTEIERIHDSRVVPFLLGVLGDRNENLEVRIHVVKQLRNRNGFLAPADRPVVARVLGDTLSDKSNVQLRLQVALTLGDFTEVDGVLSWLGAVSLAPDDSIDLRYAAFTSIERGGPRPESIALMRHIATDEALGDAARSVLSAWHAA